MGPTSRSDADNARMAERQAAVVHDFRNLLQIAVSAVATARRRLLQSYEGDLTTALDHALAALDRVNSFAGHIQMSPAAAAPVSLSLQAFLPELEALIGHTLGDRISLNLVIEHDLPPLWCDRRDLESALLNLVVNARDAMPRGGALLIEANRCPSCRPQLNCIALGVADTGHGMAPEVAARVFDLHFTTKQARGGSGIGLHNVRHFTEDLGGFADLRSSSEGTCVQLHLPTTP